MTQSSKAPYWARESLWFLGALALLVPWHCFCVATSPWFQLPPKPNGDGPDYENIAFHVWQGRGFSMDWTNDSWRAVYVQNHSQVIDVQKREKGSGVALPASPGYQVQLDRTDGFSPTTARPPLLPWIVSIVYGALGRGPESFAVVRLLLATCLGMCGAIAVLLTIKVASRLELSPDFAAMAGCATLALAFLDRTVRSYATDFLTEPIALLLVQALVWALFFLAESITQRGRSPWNAKIWMLGIGCGALCAALIAARSVMVMWLPGVWILLAGVTFVATSRGEEHSAFSYCLQTCGRAIFLSTVMLVVCCACLGPWWWRNWTLLDRSMPLGTQGPISLLGGYCDESFAARGEWQVEAESRLRRSFAEAHQVELDRGELSILEREAMLAREASEEIRRWTIAHRSDLLELGWLRLVTEWGPYSGKSLIWKGLALLGVGWLVLRRQYLAVLLLLGPILVNSLCVMLLYSVGGRFLVPNYGALYVLAAIGCIAVIESVARVRKERASQLQSQEL